MNTICSSRPPHVFRSIIFLVCIAAGSYLYYTCVLNIKVFLISNSAISSIMN